MTSVRGDLDLKITIIIIPHHFPNRIAVFPYRRNPAFKVSNEEDFNKYKT